MRGHIPGKDGIYAAVLLVEMIAVTGQSLSELYRGITDQFGEWFMVESDHRFTKAMKESITKTLMVEHQLPEFSEPVERVGWTDGCKPKFPENCNESD